MVRGGGICVTVTNFREVYNGPGRGHLCNIHISGRYTMVLGGDICVKFTHLREVYNGHGRGFLCNSDTFQGGIQWSWAGTSV